MKPIALILLFVATFCLATSAQQRISIDSLSSHIGQTVTVCSKVFGTYITKGEKPVTFLNLGANYPTQKLALVIFQKDLANCTFHPAEYFNLKEVCATGELKLYKERLEIIISITDQIIITL